MVPAKLNKQKYEYDFIAVNDRHGGGVNLDEIAYATERHVREGWRLLTVFTNELGKNAMSVGGFGVNSTIDQTILVFEREIIREEDNPDKTRFSANAPILESNLVSPFVPKEARFFEKNGGMFVILRVTGRDDFDLKGLQGDLTVRNVLGDEAVLKDVCFFSFDREYGSLVSSPFPVQLPDKISYGVSTAGLSVKRYIGNDGLVIPEDTALSSISETQSANAKASGLNNFLAEADNLSNAAEINAYAHEVAAANPGVFTNEALDRLAMFVKMEQSYGCAKSGTMRFLKKYFEDLGIQ